ncbi:LOW QUALITY PROTEIN: mitochondrial enolase superfamily member 1, partial [Morphnus guianensis]
TKYHLTETETSVSIKPLWTTLLDVHLFAQQIGPEKGAVHLAIAVVLNALWDKSMLFYFMSTLNQDAKQLLFCMDFRYISDVLTDEVAYGKSSFLQSWTLVPSIFLIFEFSHQFPDLKPSSSTSEWQMLKHGYLAYTTSCAWLGYSHQQLKQIHFGSRMKLAHKGREVIRKFFLFRVKVGADLQDDICRCRFVGEMIGPDKIMMLDANKQWEIKEATAWVTKPSEFKPLWIKEPTFPDDDMPFQTGHATISKALALLEIGVATREHYHSRVIFKQLLQADALSYLQIDSCRLGSVNENLSVLLMAKKFQSKALQNAATMRKSFSPHPPS